MNGVVLDTAMAQQAGDTLESRAQAVMDAHAKSFSWAARFLAPAAKRDAALLYAFARAADDFADEAALGSVHERAQMLAQLRAAVMSFGTGLMSAEQMASPRNGQFSVVDDRVGSAVPMASAVGNLLCAHCVSQDVTGVFMDSLEHDMQPRKFDSSAQLLEFAHGVAGTVGQMMCPILGAPAHAAPYAMALGIAMQLTNIARDVVEDAQRGRCYLPAQWQPALSIDLAELMRPPNAQQRVLFFVSIKKLLDLAEDFYAFAAQGIGAIAPENQRAIRIALVLYRAIGRKILRAGPELYWRGRAHLTPLEKARLIMGVAIRGERKSSAHVRDVVAVDLAHLHGRAGFVI